MTPMEVISLFFEKGVAFACHIVASCPPPPYRSASGIGYTSRNCLKWWAIQLAIQCTADTVNYFEQLQICEETHAGSSSRS